MKTPITVRRRVSKRKQVQVDWPNIIQGPLLGLVFTMGIIRGCWRFRDLRGYEMIWRNMACRTNLKHFPVDPSFAVVKFAKYRATHNFHRC